MKKKAVLLINLGTPDDCSKKSVRRYLNEFLLDPRVIDLPSIIRWLLVKILILPFRTSKTTRAYQKIWREGSPLLINSQKLKDALSAELGEAYQVELAMRYGKPSIQTALENLKNCRSLKVLPLFPQYSSAANGSAMEKLMRLLSSQWNTPTLFIQNDFYDDAGFIQAYAEHIQAHLNHQSIDLLLFSYHGLPLRHIEKSKNDENSYCYRTQCYITSALITNALRLSKEQYEVAFQSRLGSTPWIKPYTDLLLPELVQKGIKNIAVVCPSFVADCLETLEEVDIRLRQQWETLGGQQFIFIPCLNDTPLWVKALAKMVRHEVKQN